VGTRLRFRQQLYSHHNDWKRLRSSFGGGQVLPSVKIPSRTRGCNFQGRFLERHCGMGRELTGTHDYHMPRGGRLVTRLRAIRMIIPRDLRIRKSRSLKKYAFGMGHRNFDDEIQVQCGVKVCYIHPNRMRYCQTKALASTPSNYMKKNLYMKVYPCQS
jgi:hypothetical protein